MNDRYFSDQVMVLDSNDQMIADIIVVRENRAYTATLSTFGAPEGEMFPCPIMTRRNGNERTAIRDVLAHALVSGANPTVGRMTATDIAAAHALTLESVFIDHAAKIY